MARLSRVESQERTRERLVATARDLFLRNGYGATSLSQVAETAGYSKGAVYSNFRNKDYLCLAVLDDIRTEQLTLLTDSVMREGRIDDRLATFAAWGEAHIGDEAWTTLEVEFLIRARHDDELRREITARVGAIREALAQLLDALAGELGATLAMPADQAAMTLLSLGIGLGVQRVADPAVPTAVLTDTLRLVLGLSG
ncbi:TetR/AcrR family transcriptional regulator [Streptomyces sp. NPDC014995]|uniref:TetR/AcrR family transcriptional regulator n=1 Tax=Streptomyces sp. NPDC014995 TaxID=3364936 RepID=UPI0036F651CB